MSTSTTTLPIALVGDGLLVPCVDGVERPYVNLDAAASTSALPAVAERVHAFLPWYSSVHRGAGFKSQEATAAYEAARAAAMRFAGHPNGGGGSGNGGGGERVAVFVRNTTEAVNVLAHRLRLAPDDVVVTTVVEHHANLLPWARAARRRFVDCGPDGTFNIDDVVAALLDGPRPRLLAVTGASNVTGWMPPIDDLVDAAHRVGVPVLVDAAQLAPHRPMPPSADFVAWSGHKMYAPFGAGVLIGPRATFVDGDPFLAGGGAVDLVDLDEVAWTEPPEREEAGSPNVLGAVALGAAIDELERIGWPAIIEHDDTLAHHLRHRLLEVPGVRLLGPADGTLPLATFVVDGMHHALVAARLSAEHGIGVRHGCFCAHPYLMRLLDLAPERIASYRDAVLHHDRRDVPGAVRASCGIGSTTADVDRLVEAVGRLAAGESAPVPYVQDPVTGDFHPEGDIPGWSARTAGSSCARG